MKITRILSLLSATAALTFGVHAKAATQDLETTGWRCEAEGLLYYAPTCELPYSCMRNRQFGAAQLTLDAAQEDAKKHLVEVANSVGVTRVEQVEIFGCTKGNEPVGDKVTINGWSRNFVFLLDFDSFYRAKTICATIGFDYARNPAPLTQTMRADGSTDTVGEFTCIHLKGDVN